MITQHLAASSNGAATIAGTGYAVDNTITIADSKLGGGGAAALTFDVASIDTTGVATPTISGLDNLEVELDDATVTLTQYKDIQNNYTTGVITATLANDAIADVIAETTTGTNDLVSGNAFTSLTVTLTELTWYDIRFNTLIHTGAPTDCRRYATVLLCRILVMHSWTWDVAMTPTDTDQYLQQI